VITTRRNGDPHEYLVDGLEDLELTPQRKAGTTCLVLSTGDLYYVDREGEWRPLSSIASMPGPVGPQGPKGEAGPRGPQGARG
jgi:hypothetical protein